tara:strand:- start:58 stop:489 length:432 start_codon:yes stop_codon:yes gene_type:complete
MNTLELDVLVSLKNINWKPIFDVFRNYQRDVQFNLELMRDGADILYDPIKSNFVLIKMSEKTIIKYYYQRYPEDFRKQLDFEDHVTLNMTKYNVKNLSKLYKKKNNFIDLSTLCSIKIIENILQKQNTIKEIHDVINVLEHNY